mgnify:CR=1 FL=1
MARKTLRTNQHLSLPVPQLQDGNDEWFKSTLRREFETVLAQLTSSQTVYVDWPNYPDQLVWDLRISPYPSLTLRCVRVLKRPHAMQYSLYQRTCEHALILHTYVKTNVFDSRVQVLLFSMH